MQLTARLVETEQQIAKKIGEAIATEFNKKLINIANKVRPQIQNIVFTAIMNSPEVQSLQGGDLQAELGVPDAAGRVRNLAELWAKSIRVVSFQPAKMQGGFFRATLELGGIQSDFADALSSPDAIYTTNSGQVIQWLEWLLIEGDKVIIREYQIGLDVYDVSRTGLGNVMIKNQKASWSVPAHFAGTEDDNFVTRAIDTVADDIQKLIASEL
jgi:hypothetical protein